MLKNTFFVLFISTVFIACGRKSTMLPTKSDNKDSVSFKCWMISEEKTGKLPCESDRVIPNRYRLTSPDSAYVFSQLRNSDGLNDTVEVQLPLSNGSTVSARLARSASVPMEFERKYGISAFSGRLTGFNGSVVRLEVDSSKGIRYMAIIETGTTVLYRVCTEGPWNYIVFDKNDLPVGSKTGFE
ncbi:MAG: hypothetical protein ACKO9S_13165 [Bacteroidota bacterium]